MGVPSRIERHPERCSIAAKLQHPSQMIFGVILQIGHLGHTSLDQRPADNRSTPRFDGQTLQIFSVLMCLAPFA